MAKEKLANVRGQKCLYSSIEYGRRNVTFERRVLIFSQNSKRQ